MMVNLPDRPAFQDHSEIQCRTPNEDQFAHDDYPADCCGDHDCHPVPCDEITVRSDGDLWKGLIFLWSSLRTSPDGRCHVCHLMKGTIPVLPIWHHARRNVINSADQQYALPPYFPTLAHGRLASS